MITFTVKPTGGDFTDLNVCLNAIVNGLNSSFYAPTETFTVVLDDIVNYPVGIAELSIVPTVNTSILIIAGEGLWQKPRIAVTDGSWLEITANGQCSISVFGLILSCDGCFLEAETNDVLISGCITEGNGILVNAKEGQIQVSGVMGDPMDVIVVGDPLYAANSADGLSTTLDRPSLIASASRLGTIRVNKPVIITDCGDHGRGIDRYEEITDYPLNDFHRKYYTRIGNYLDKIDFLTYGDGSPLLTIRDGGLYRRMTLRGLGAGKANVLNTLVLVDGANKKQVDFDRVYFGEADHAMTFTQAAGKVNITNSVFSNLNKSVIRNEVPDWDGWLTAFNNRGNVGGGDMVNFDCTETGDGLCCGQA